MDQRAHSEPWSHWCSNSTASGSSGCKPIRWLHVPKAGTTFVVADFWHRLESWEQSFCRETGANYTTTPTGGAPADKDGPAAPDPNEMRNLAYTSAGPARGRLLQAALSEWRVQVHGPLNESRWQRAEWLRKRTGFRQHWWKR